MSNAMVSIRSGSILLFAVTVIAGCAGSDYPPPETHGTGEPDTLRVTTDTARSRVWVLGLDGVRVYDAVTKKLTRQIALPSWSVAPTPYACLPDLALDRSGSAFISSNATPVIWRIDADSFEVKQHEIRLHGREQWDIGFGALAFTADGVLYALTSSESSSLWKIDFAKASGTMIAFRDPPSKACEKRGRESFLPQKDSRPLFGHSAFIPARLMRSAYFFRSFAIKAANAAGVVPAASTP